MAPEAQAQLIAQHVDCVIGMADAIHDLAAIEFATNFYFGLGSGFNIKDAYELGRTCVTFLPLKDYAQFFPRHIKRKIMKPTRRR
jgi:hypothetical protein